MGKIFPNNWCLIKSEYISDITDYVANGSFQTLSENVKVTDNNGFAVLIRLKDFNNDFRNELKFVDEHSYNFLRKSTLIPGDLFISNVGNPGLCFVVPDLKKPMTLGPNGIRARVNKFYNLFFFKYFIESPQGKKSLKGIISGTAQQKFNKTDFRNLFFPLPPLREQKRIVAKLDNLFAQHEAMKKALERIPELLKDFKQKVLTQAIRGQLTKEWRKSKDVEEWSYKRALDCCLKVQSGGTPKGSKFSAYGIPFLKVYNIVNNKINFDYKPQYVSEEIHNSQLKKSIAYPGDVIMNIVGPPLNKIAILNDQYPEWNLNQAITIFRVGEKLSNRYLYYFFCEGSSVKSLVNETKGVVGQVNISLSQCRNFDIPVPSIKEQKEIVYRVESLFTKADKIEEKYKVLKSKIEALPQSILHKAFKGELVNQLPTDGDAKDLLEEIKKIKI